MQRKITYAQQAEILGNAYLSLEDIRKLIPISRDQAYQIMNELFGLMEERNISRFEQRKKLVPTDLVVEYLKLDVNYINRQARKGRKWKERYLKDGCNGYWYLLH